MVEGEREAVGCAKVVYIMRAGRCELTIQGMLESGNLCPVPTGTLFFRGLEVPA